MKGKRLVSILLILCMVLTFMPEVSLPVRAEDYPDPEYIKAYSPEFIIFNAESGSNEEFFQSVMSDSRFNAVAAGKFLKTPKQDVALKYGDKISGSGVTWFTWDDFRNTQLAKLSDAEDQLEVGLAVTVTNDYHKHTYSIWDCWLTSYMDVTLSTYATASSICVARGYSKSQSTIRRGNASFKDIPQKMAAAEGWSGNPLTVEYYGSILGYHNDQGTCKCGGTAEKTVVSFYDGTAPTIESVRVTRAGETGLCWNFKRGDVINIEFTCSESLRFSDDTAKNKGNICIGLMVEGRTDRLYAYLTSLSGNKLTFQYHVDPNDTEQYTVTGLDLTSAAAGKLALATTKTKDTGIPLKYVYGSKTYTANQPDSAPSAVGYSETTSYITDLAGNPLSLTKWDLVPDLDENGNFVYKDEPQAGGTNEAENTVRTVKTHWAQVSAIPRVDFYIDCQDPFVAKVSIVADTKNADVKAALGQSGLDPSDQYLGVGDTFHLVLYMNELVLFSAGPDIKLNIGSTAYSNYQLTAYTVNFGRTEAVNVGSEYGKGASGGKVTVITTNEITVTEPLVLNGTEGYIRIDSISFWDSFSNRVGIWDYAGNEAQDIPSGAYPEDKQPEQEYALDTTPPDTAVETATQTGGVNEAFYVPFTVTDNASGVNQMPGKFTLNEPDGRTSAYQYAVTESAAAPKESDWKNAIMGSPVDFTQSAAQLFLHIRPVAGVAYNFSSEAPATLTFTLKDYAGNMGDTTPKPIQGAAMDSLPPTATAGAVARTYDNNANEGTLSVTVNARDPSGLQKVEYQWSAYTVTSDTELPDAWVDAIGALGNGSSAAVTAARTVPNNTAFRGNLWIRATDKAGLSSVTNLGDFGYDLLTGIQYSLSYSAAILPRTGVSIDSLQTGGYLVFDVQVENDDTHYVAYYYNEITTVDTSNIFNRDTYWYASTLDDSDGFRFSLGDREDFFVDESYAGTVYVTVYSGDASTIIRKSGEIQVNTNAKAERFTLRQSPAKPSLQYISKAFSGTSLFSFDGAAYEKLTQYPPTQWYAKEGYSTYCSTLEGVQVRIDLGGDSHGWDYADIDWDNSYIFYYDGSDGRYTHNTTDYVTLLAYVQAHPELRLCGIGRGPSQTVTLPTSELYTTGYYQELYLILARYSSDVPYIIMMNQHPMMTLDTTEPGRLVLSYLGSIEDSTGNPPIEGLPFDPDRTAYIPTEGREVKLSVEVLAADGNNTLPINTGYMSRFLGQYDVVAWNVTTDPTGTSKISLAHVWYEEGAPDYGYNAMFEYDYNKRALTLGRENDYATLGLLPGQDNLVALQVVYDNGKTSEITYLTVHPAVITLTGEAVTSPEAVGGDGLVTVDPGTGTVVFTPAGGMNTAGLTLYCSPGYKYLYRESTYDSETGTTVYSDWIEGYYVQSSGIELFGDAFKMQQEGESYIWRVPDADLDAYSTACDLYYEHLGQPDEDLYPFPPPYAGILEAGEYEMHNSLAYYFGLDGSVPFNGSKPAGFYVVYATDAYQNVHYIAVTGNGIIADGTAPYVGDFELPEGIADPTYYDNVWIPGHIAAAADGTYAATFTVRDDSLFSNAGGILSRPMTLTLSYDDAYAQAAGAGTLILTDVGDGYLWQPEEGSNMGITAVRASLVSAGQFHGYHEYHEDFSIVTYDGKPNDVRLIVTVEGVISPKVTSAMDMTLYLRAEDAHGNISEAAGVTAAGVTGVIPEILSAEYRATGEGDDMALYVTFNTPVQPKESWINRAVNGFDTVWHDAFPVWRDGDWEITVNDAFGTPYALPLKLDGVFGDYGIDLGFSTLDYVTAETGVTITAAADGPNETVTGSTTATANGIYLVKRTAGGKTDTLTIDLNNIVSGGPEETLFFYFEEFGDMYRAGSNPQGVTTAPVVVSYRTDRETSPIGATTQTFRDGDEDKDRFTFQYYDPATDLTYTISGRLRDYGITLGAPPEPYQDTEKPSIDIVTIWKQRGGGFVQTEAFPGSADEADIETAIEHAGIAQSYDFVVKASDYSRWKVVVRTAEPTGMTYAGAESDVPGVTVEGNNVLVTKEVAGDFWIVVVDNAAADTGAAKDNFTAIRIPCGQYQFDTTPPVIETLTVADGMYSKTVYFRGTDVDDLGRDTGTVTISGAGIVEHNDEGYEAYPYKLLFTDNDTQVPVTATDGAGNSSVTMIQVTGIDVTVPILFITWTPCFQDVNTGELDHANPTAGPVNVNVVAHITSDKPIYNVAAKVDGAELVFDENKLALAAWGSVEYTGERITVCFTEKEASAVQLTVTAPNGKSITQSIALGAGVIDKDPPVVTDTVTPLLREGFGTAYAEKHSLTFNEDVFCISSATPRTVYSAAYPYELTLAEGETADLTFVDRAGNLLNYTVLPQGEIDSARPEVTAQLDEELSVTNSPVPVTLTANEAVTLTADDAAVTCGEMTPGTDAEGNSVWTGTVTAAENGTFRVIAADAAGNETNVVFTVYNVDKTLPNLSFERSAVGLRQGSGKDELNALLKEGVTVWDNAGIKDGTLTWYTDGVTLYDTEYPPVDLEVPGIYEIPYTVEDEAGNVGLAIRWLKVIDKYQLVITVDGIMTEMNGTIALGGGVHTITVGGLREENEPYTLKLAKGIWSSGQMKRIQEEIFVGADGSVTLEEAGFYTLFVITQSRKAFRTMLNVIN